MEICIRNATGERARAITQSQFKVLEGAIIDMMNGGKRLKDIDALARLEAAGDALDFLPCVLMEVALYEDAPYVPFLGAWCGSDVEDHLAVTMLARNELSKEEFALFDMATSVETQRTFLYLVAYAHGARAQGPMPVTQPPKNGAIYYDAVGDIEEIVPMDGRKFLNALVSEAYTYGAAKKHHAWELYRGGELVQGKTLISQGD